MFDVICCEGFKCFATFKSWICCQNRENISKNKIIIFAKLPDGVDCKFLFVNHDLKNSINIVFNSNQDIITAHAANLGRLFDKKTDNIVGLNLRELTQFIPAGIIDMIGIILKSVEMDGVMRGCLIYIDGISHICCGFPIIDTTQRVISVLLVKKEINEGLLNANAILGHDNRIKPLTDSAMPYSHYGEKMVDI